MSLWYPAKSPAPLGGIASPISSFVVFDTGLEGACQLDWCYSLPYANGDRLAFQVSYTDAGLAPLNVLPSNLFVRPKSLPATTFNPIAVDTIRKVVLFAVTMSAAWGCTELEVVAPVASANVVSNANNGTFDGGSGLAGIAGTGFVQSATIRPGATGTSLRVKDQVGVEIGNARIAFPTQTGNIRIRFWYFVPNTYPGGQNPCVYLQVTFGNGFANAVQLTARNTWTLYEVIIPASSITGIGFDARFGFEGGSGYQFHNVADNANEIYIDDLTVVTITNTTAATSNRFCPVPVDCATAVLKYRNQTDAYGASYQQDETFYQEVRLPAQLLNLQPVVEDAAYTLPNQQEIVTSSRMGRSLDLRVGPMPDRLVEAFMAARGHTDVQLDGNPVRISEPQVEALARTAADWSERIVSAKVRDNGFAAQSLLG